MGLPSSPVFHNVDALVLVDTLLLQIVRDFSPPFSLDQKKDNSYRPPNIYGYS